MNPQKHGLLLALAFSGSVLLSACQGETGAEPLPRASSSSAAPVVPSPSPTRPAWEAKYTPKQLRAYRAALRRFQEYEKRSEPIWAAGKANAQTERLFKTYFLAWFNEQRLLTTNEDAGLRLFGLGRTLNSRPTRVAISDEGESVTIKQCVDLNSTRATQYGKETEKFTRKPQVRTIVLSRFNRPQAAWMITDLKTSLGKRPCSAA